MICWVNPTPSRACRVPRKLACDMGQLSPFGGKAFFTDVERHYCIAVAGDDLRAGLDERRMSGNHGLRCFGQGQSRPFGLAERRAHTFQLAAHAAVKDGEGHVCSVWLADAAGVASDWNPATSRSIDSAIWSRTAASAASGVPCSMASNSRR